MPVLTGSVHADILTKPSRAVFAVIRLELIEPGAATCVFIMRQGRGSEATETVFFLQAKKPLHSGSYEHRVPKIKNHNIVLYQGCLRDSTS